MVTSGPDTTYGSSEPVANAEAHTVPRRSKRVELLVVEEDHLPYLRSLMLHPDVHHRFVWNGSTPTLQDVQRVLGDRTLAQFLVAKRTDRQVAGLLHCHDPDWRRGTARLVSLIDPEWQRRIWPIEGMVLFVNYLFQTFPLRKLYGEVLEYNFSQFSSGGSSLFKVEGVLKDHEWHLGRLWNTHIVSVSRIDWAASTRTGRWRRMFEPEHEGSVDGNLTGRQ